MIPGEGQFGGAYAHTGWRNPDFLRNVLAAIQPRINPVPPTPRTAVTHLPTPNAQALAHANANARFLRPSDWQPPGRVNQAPKPPPAPRQHPALPQFPQIDPRLVTPWPRFLPQQMPQIDWASLLAQAVPYQRPTPMQVAALWAGLPSVARPPGVIY